MNSVAVQVLYERRLFLIALFLVTFIFAYGCFYIWPPQYQATARIIIEPNTLDIDNLNQNEELPDVIVRNEFEMLKSISLFSAALRKTGLDPNPNTSVFKKYYSRLKVKQLPYSTVLEIQISGSSPRVITNLVNNLVECLIEEDKQAREKEVTQALHYLTEKIDQIRAEKMALNNNSKSDSFSQKPNLTERILNETQKKLYQYETEFTTLKNKIKGQDWQKAADIFSENSNLSRVFQRNINNHINSLLELLLQNNPKQKEINALQAEIWREKVKTSKSMLSMLNQLQFYDSYWEQLCFTHLRIIEMKMRRDKLSKFTKSGPAVNDVNTTQLPTAKKLNSLLDMETLLIQKLVSLQMSKGLTELEVRWLDRAVIPEKPFFPTLTLNIALSFLSALGIVVVIAYIGIIAAEWRKVNKLKLINE